MHRIRATAAGLALAAAALLAVALPGDAAAPPSPGVGASLRLISAGAVDGRPALGLEIALEPGWKTYWRTPGDAGIPPTVDWSRSKGISGLDLRFPAPVRFGEEGARSIGYTAPVILPIDLTLADAAAPAEIDLDVQIGICRDICIPVSAHLSARLAPGAPVDAAAAARLAAARAGLPVPAVKGVAPWVIAVTRDAASTSPAAVLVAVKTADGDDRRDVLVEGPTADWALPLPVKVAESPGRETWRFELDGIPKDARLAGTPLRFTMRAKDRVVEQTVTLDAAAVAP